MRVKPWRVLPRESTRELRQPTGGKAQVASRPPGPGWEAAIAPDRSARIWAGACVRSRRSGRSSSSQSTRPAGAAPTVQSRSDVRTHERLLAGEPRDASKRLAARIDRPEPRREQSLVAQADSSAQLGKQVRRSRGPRRARSFHLDMPLGRADTSAGKLLAATLQALVVGGYCSVVDAGVSATRPGRIAQLPRSTHVIGRDWVVVDARFRTRPRVRLPRHGTGGQCRFLVRSDRLPAFVTRLRVGRV